MLTIAETADRIGEYICTQAEMELEVKKICYGIECVLVLFGSLILILSLGWLAGVIQETLVIALAVLIMKYIIGGPHLSGFLRCIGLSSFLIVGAAWLLKINYFRFSVWTLLCLLIIEILIIYRYAPLATSDTKFTAESILKRRILATVILCLVTFLHFFNANYWWSGVILGVSISVLNISPIGVFLVQWVELITSRKEVIS